MTVPKAEQQNVEVKKRLLLERSQLVQRTLNAINAGARLPEVPPLLCLPLCVASAPPPPLFSEKEELCSRDFSLKKITHNL